MKIQESLKSASDKLGDLTPILDKLSKRWWKSATTHHAQKSTVGALTGAAAFRLVVTPFQLRRNRPLNKHAVAGSTYTTLGRKLVFVRLGLDAFTVAIGTYELIRQARQENTTSR